MRLPRATGNRTPHVYLLSIEYSALNVLFRKILSCPQRTHAASLEIVATTQKVVVRRADPKVGEINVHFPLAGFDVSPA
jgi:hypothetical protein